MKDVATQHVVEINDDYLLKCGFASLKPYHPDVNRIPLDVDPHDEEIHTALRDAGLRCVVTGDNKVLAYAPWHKVGNKFQRMVPKPKG